MNVHFDTLDLDMPCERNICHIDFKLVEGIDNRFLLYTSASFHANTPSHQPGSFCGNVSYVLYFVLEPIHTCMQSISYCAD